MITALVRVIEIRKLPVLNQGEGDLPIIMSGKRQCYGAS